MSALDALLEGFDEARHPRGFRGRWIATFHHPVHGQTTAPIEASSSTEAWSRAEARATEAGSVVQSLTPADQSTEKGATQAEHAELTRRLEGLQPGRFLTRHGSHARRTDAGFEIYHPGDTQPRKVIKQPSKAAGEMRRAGRRGTSSSRAAQAHRDRDAYGHTVGLRRRSTPRARRVMALALSDPTGIGTLVEAFAPPETAPQSMAIGDRQQAAAKAELASGRWNASKHPRGRGGKFGYTTGGKRAKRGHPAQGNTLTVGTRGAMVRSVQKQLGIAQDGIYGQQTRAAVFRFQAQHGLAQDGVVGRQTLAALRGQQGARKIAPGPIKAKQARVMKPRAARTPAPVRAPGGGVFAG